MSYYIHTPLIALFISWVLLILVLRRDHRSSLHRVFSLFLLSMGFWGLIVFGMRSSPDLESALRWDKALIAIGPWTSVFFYHFTLLFSHARSKARIITSAYLFCILFSILAPTNLLFKGMQIGVYGYAPIIGILAYPAILSIYVFVVLGIYNLLRYHRSSISPGERHRTTLIIVGAVSSLLGGMADIAHLFGLSIPPLGIIGNILFGFLATVAILRYGFLDVRVVLRKGLAYTFISGLIIGIYVLAVFLINRFLEIKEISLAISVLLVLLIAIALQPMLLQIQGIIDKWFYRDRYNQLKILEEFSQEKHVVTDLEHLSSSLVNLVKQALRSRSVGLLMPSGQEENYRLIASVGLGGTSSQPYLESRRPTVRWLRTQALCLSRNDIDIIPKLQAVSAIEMESIQQLDAELLVALRNSDDLVGIIVLGPKLSGEVYSADDKRVLTVVSQHITATLENARLFQDLNQAYIDLKEAQERLIQSERLKALGEMTSGIAHDFNNILTSISGNTQLVLRWLNDEKMIRRLQTVKQSTQDAAGMVRRLQDFARVRADCSSEIVDINEIVKDALEMVRPRLDEQREARNAGIELFTDLGDIGNAEGDAGELREALTNILINAIEAMPDGGKLDIRSRNQAGSIYISLSDTGTGMSGDTIKRVFEPFFTTKGEQGLGMGLSVVYGTVRRHGGDIAVSSTVGKGSTFTIQLPVTERYENKIVKQKLRTTDRIVADVLVVDDDKNCRELLYSILFEAGVMVDIASTGAEGIALAGRKAYDIALLDLGMPDISGIELGSQIRELNSNTQLVLVTGWGVQLDSDDLNRRGFNRIIPKPFTEDEIISVVAQLMDNKLQPR